ncbi:MAG: putative metal-binding motif-containing protein [Sandaracinus sp.]
MSLSSLGCGGTSFACPEGFETSADGRCVLPDAGSMPMADGGEGAPDAFAADLDAGTAQPDAFVAMTDAAVELPDAYVEVPDAYVEVPDAYLPPPDACAYGTWYADGDGDGFGRASAPVSGCMQPPGTVIDATDCDDASAARHPGATEACNMVDDDCDGTTDEGVRPTLYLDADGDGFGVTATTAFCAPQDHVVAQSGDCNDGNAAVHPGATEVCNTVDDDCNGTIDEGVTIVFFRDADGDGYGSASMASAPLCMAPSGFVASSNDCDDVRATVHPGATEVCNTIDDNCNGTVDEGVQTTWYADCDHDGYAPLGAQTYLGCPGISPPVVGPLDCTDPTHLAGAWITTAPTTAINDCGPNEPRAHPGQTQWYAAGYFAGARLTYDFDCDGASTLQYAGYTATATCRVSGLSCNPAGSSWVGSRAPSCGESGSLYRCDHQVSGCVASAPMTVPAACR